MGKEDFSSFDSLISYPLSHKVVPYLNKYGITPNQITYFNLFFRILISILYYKDVNIVIIVTLYVISQIIDCMDGTMARKYGMGSEFGKKLDINTDIIVRIILYNFIILKHKNMIKYIFPYFIIDMISSLLYVNNNQEIRHLEMNGPILIIIFFILVEYLKNK
jgi:phosphatidylglycerophosphate synthase